MILVTGASGLLGANLVLNWHNAGERVGAVWNQHALQLQGVEGFQADLLQPGRGAALVDQVKPSWIVHCAARTNVDWCEQHAQDAFHMHVDVTRQLAAAAREHDAGFAIISTDSVFDGMRGAYVEADDPVPLNVYARTKLAGEQAAQSAHPRSLIVRTNFYGWNMVRKLSLAEWVLNRLERDEVVPGFSDVVFAPLLANQLAELLRDMMQRGLRGLYHLAAADAVSKYEFARQIAREFGYDEALVVPASIVDAGLRAPRPRNTALRATKAERKLRRAMPSVASGLRAYRQLRDAGYAKRLSDMHTEEVYAGI